MSMQFLRIWAFCPKIHKVYYQIHTPPFRANVLHGTLQNSGQILGHCLSSKHVGWLKFRVDRKHAKNRIWEFDSQTLHRRWRCLSQIPSFVSLQKWGGGDVGASGFGIFPIDTLQIELVWVLGYVRICTNPPPPCPCLPRLTIGFHFTSYY